MKLRNLCIAVVGLMALAPHFPSPAEAGLFDTRMDVAVGDEPNAVAAGDLENDGCWNIVTVNRGDTTYSVLLSNGNEY